jgi:hypothetical protein
MNHEQENLDNFWAVFSNPQPESAPPMIFYRLYHDEMGRPLFYSMQDEPGNYIEIDQDTFQKQPKHARVRNGKLIEIITHEIRKLIPGESGTPCDPRDVCVVVDSTQSHINWSLKIDETN